MANSAHRDVAIHLPRLGRTPLLLATQGASDRRESNTIAIVTSTTMHPASSIQIALNGEPFARFRENHRHAKQGDGDVSTKTDIDIAIGFAHTSMVITVVMKGIFLMAKAQR